MNKEHEQALIRKRGNVIKVPRVGGISIRKERERHHRKKTKTEKTETRE